MDRSTLEWYEMLARGLIWLAGIVLLLAIVGAVVIAGSNDSLGVLPGNVEQQGRGVAALASLGGGLTAAGVLAALGAILRLHIADHMPLLPDEPETAEEPASAQAAKPATKPKRSSSSDDRPRSRSRKQRAIVDRESKEREQE